jgi:hypothetical protein
MKEARHQQWTKTKRKASRATSRVSTWPLHTSAEDKTNPDPINKDLSFATLLTRIVQSAVYDYVYRMALSLR